MKRIHLAVLCLSLLLALTACSSAQSSESTPTVNPTQAVSTGAVSKSGPGAVLVAWFSVPEDVVLDGVDAVSGASKLAKYSVEYGNTEYIARLIADCTGGTLFEIASSQDYPREHAALLDFAKSEQNQDARPELRGNIENLESFDTVFIGYPIWWGDLPQPLYSFLENHDFSGKRLVLFSTHGGSRLANTVRTIASLQPGAILSENALTIDRNDVVNTTQDEIDAWIDSLEL